MKLLNMWLTLLFFHFTIADFISNTSTLHPPLERMLSRKKRFLLLPKGSNIKFTIQLSKRLLAAFPRGFNFNLEVAFYYPTPGARIDLIPKRLRKPTTTTPKPIGTKPPIFVCIPGSLICYKAKPATKPSKIQRIDENGNTIQWIEPKKPINYQSYQQFGQQYNNPQQWAQWANYSQPQHYEKHKWSSQKYQQKWQPKPNAKWTKWTTTSPIQQNNWKWQQNTTNYNKWSQPRLQQYQNQYRQQRWRRTLSRVHPYLPLKEEANPHDQLYKYEPIQFADLEEHYDWHHYHNHRDRRQLFHHFEGLSQILGFDMKSCIMRAICESKRYLLPPGYSMMQDLLRLVFTLPTISGLTDDYSEAMRADYETCDKVLRPKCALNMLNWLLNPKQGSRMF